MKKIILVLALAAIGSSLFVSQAQACQDKGKAHAHKGAHHAQHHAKKHKLA